MPELSKTARASMGKVEKKAKVEESTEEAIRQIRIDRQAVPPLAILNGERVDKLLAAYDALKALVDPANQIVVGGVMTYARTTQD